DELLLCKRYCDQNLIKDESRRISDSPAFTFFSDSSHFPGNFLIVIRISHLECFHYILMIVFISVLVHLIRGLAFLFFFLDSSILIIGFISVLAHLIRGLDFLYFHLESDNSFYLGF